jgi:succinylglutamic semialdehyde dehydrogenase
VFEGVPRFKKPDYWDEELFAPDAAVYVMKSAEEMAAFHNASRFGLAAAVFTASEAAFRGLFDRLEAGVIHWNRSTAMTPGRLPFGGVKASGNHRPAGLHAVLSCVTPVGSVEKAVP